MNEIQRYLAEEHVEDFEDGPINRRELLRRYGPAPSDVAGIGTTKAAVLAVFAEQDTRVNAGKDTIEPQLKRAGIPYQITVYPGVNHAFYNDTGQRYSPDQARKAWDDTIAWFQRYLR